jgi:flagellar protein FliS
MQYSKFAKSYKANSVETASPGKLVLMLFDGALRFMHAAKMGFEEENFLKKNEQINNNLIRAQNIVTELQSSLDLSVPGDLPETLYKLYDYCNYHLQQANMNKDIEPIKYAESTIKELRDAWAEMLTQNGGQHPTQQAPAQALPNVSETGSISFHA